MIPVEQRHLAVFDEQGDCVQHGDCLTACVASLFELPIDGVPFFVESDRWWHEYHEFVAARGLCIERAWITVDETDPTKLSGWPGDRWWIATVKSPRGLARCSACKGSGQEERYWDGDQFVELDEARPCSYCTDGLAPSLHAIVMYGRELAWDPHPQREMGHLGFVSGEQFGAPDPAKLVLRSER